MSATISTHVLDTSRGLPAIGLMVTLEHHDGDAWVERGAGTTDADGRIRDLLPPSLFDFGVWRLTFHTKPWFAGHGVTSFYPEVVVHFEVTDASRHHHVPLLLNPFGYATYRGT